MFIPGVAALLFVTRTFWTWSLISWVSLHRHKRLRSRTRPSSLRRNSVQSSLIRMAQPTTVTILRRQSTLSCSHGLMNTSMNASVGMISSLSSVFLTFPGPITSRLDPIPSISLPSTLPINASITSFRRSSLRAMSLNTTATASPVLCHRYPTSIIQNACNYCGINLADLSIMDGQARSVPKNAMVGAFRKSGANHSSLRSAQRTAQAFQHSPSTTSTDPLLIQLRGSLNQILMNSALTLSAYFVATPLVLRQQPVGRVLVPSIRSAWTVFGQSNCN